jgi:hypothetical protein
MFQAKGGIVNLLKGKENVDESCYGLYCAAVLGMVYEVANARLEFGVPVKDIELHFLERLPTLIRISILKKELLSTLGRGQEIDLGVNPHTCAFWKDASEPPG